MGSCAGQSQEKEASDEHEKQENHKIEPKAQFQMTCLEGEVVE